MSEEARLAIVKDVCSNCAPKNIPENEQPKKLGLQLTLSGKSVTICYDCLKLMMAKINDIKAMESGVV